MSWQEYVDSNLVGTGKVSRAAILGQQGGVWAATSGYTLSPEEQTGVIGAFNNLDHTRAHGITLANKKYFVLRAEEGRSIYGKKESDGVIIVRTTQAILVAEYSQPTQAGEATPVVENLADYLISVKY